MKFLSKIEYKSATHPFKKGYAVQFTAPCTFLVGENGCGKSTILDTIRSYFDVNDQTYLKRQDLHKSAILTVKGKPPVVYYDAHADNFKFSNVFGDDIGTQMMQQKASSGISSVITLKGKLQDWKVRDSLIVLDEPCRGLSIRSQHRLMPMLVKLVTSGNQIICATHSDAFMSLNLLDKLFQLYSVEHGEYKGYDSLMEEWKKIGE